MRSGHMESTCKQLLHRPFRVLIGQFLIFQISELPTVARAKHNQDFCERDWLTKRISNLEVAHRGSRENLVNLDWSKQRIAMKNQCKIRTSVAPAIFQKSRNTLKLLDKQ